MTAVWWDDTPTDTELRAEGPTDPAATRAASARFAARLTAEQRAEVALPWAEVGVDPWGIGCARRACLNTTDGDLYCDEHKTARWRG